MRFNLYDRDGRFVMQVTLSPHAAFPHIIKFRDRFFCSDYTLSDALRMHEATCGIYMYHEKRVYTAITPSIGIRT